VPLRAIKGATTVAVDGAREICDATSELLGVLLAANGLGVGDVVSLFLTATPDLRSEFPARGAREAGWDDVPMLCAAELSVPGALPRCIRALVHVELPAGRLPRHEYLRGARVLRPDLGGTAPGVP
jgi:chorismate mutase